MFREPDEVHADQAAAKLDQLAATRRSNIRRESSVRPGRTSSSRSLIDRIRDTRREPADESRTTPLQSRQPRDLSQDIYELDSDLGRLRSVRLRQRARASLLERDSARRSERTRLEPAARTDTDIDLLDRLRFSTGGASSGGDTDQDVGIEILSSDSHETIAQHLPRPSRESGLRFEVAAASQPESEPSRRTHFHMAVTRAPSPSASRRLAAIGPTYMINGRRYGLRQDLAGPIVTYSLHPNSAPTFPESAPAPPESAPAPPESAPAPDPPGASVEPLGQEQPRLNERDLLDGFMDTTPPENFDTSYPPLRRVNHESPRPGVGSSSRIDGLGDRLRSPSPASDAHEEENWGTLLTTMEPGRSSATTSFMSSLPDAQSGSNRSSQATTAATSFGEIGGDDSCDLDLPSGITEADVREIRARHGRVRRDLAPRPDDPVHEAIQRDLSRGNDRILELEVFSVILDRMQRREEIPDEWWAAVGLSPDVVRGGT
ncbi:hypothetical protein A1O3_10010 [Capronia epimyces CBS 606.96]|uniref:Uncharacterized protein n=1 Tax=Capronia epimyces CBS 606.96 TaxID=1182542 RepID=W9XLD1_9EURO|nr:uncharacterized protein A1O3_10010 [Capronia epimyces CBS 606.96]EXJ77781.1 hypothetical protein A1O3_10010 [Capronia epimyces CBS 606.96]